MVLFNQYKRLRENLYYLVTQRIAQKSVLLFTIRPTQNVAQSFVLPPPFPPAAKGVAYSDSCYLPANRLLPTKQWAAAY